DQTKPKVDTRQVSRPDPNRAAFVAPVHPAAIVETPYTPTVPPAVGPAIPAPEADAPPGDRLVPPVRAEPPRAPERPPVTPLEREAQTDGMLPGLEKIKRISGHWGFQGKTLASEVRIEASQSLAGIAALLEQPAFRKDQLPPIPAGVAGFV